MYVKMVCVECGLLVVVYLYVIVEVQCIMLCDFKTGESNENGTCIHSVRSLPLILSMLGLLVFCELLFSFDLPPYHER